MQRKQRLTAEEIDAALVRARALYSTRPNAVYEAALGYGARGWPLTVLPLAGTDENVGKKPMLKGWQNLRLTSAEQVHQYFHNRMVNVGIILGQASGLIDVDLDCQEAIDQADKCLPPTNSIFWRASAPRSHRLYRGIGAALSRSFRDPIDKEIMIVELRGDTHRGEPGKQTALPGSLHVLSGEWIEWVEDGEPACPAYVDLHRCMVQLATMIIITRHCPGAATDEEIRYALIKADPRVRQRIDLWKKWQQEVEGWPDRQSSSKQPPPGGGPDKQAPPAADAKPPPTEHEIARVYTALTYISSSDRNERWLPIGGALHDLPGWSEELSRATWDKWSRDMDPTQKFDEADQEKTWESFGRGYTGKRTTLGTVFHLAREGGWDGHTLKPLPDELRALVPPPSVAPPPSGAAAALMAAAEQLLSMSFADRMLLRRKVSDDHNVTVADLDRLVRMLEKSKAADDGDNQQQGQALNFAEPEPWHEPVDGRELVRDIGLAIRRHVVVAAEYLLVLALWCIHTYLIEDLKCTPRLFVRAATEGSGKTLLMTLLRYLVWRPLKVVNITSAALFRAIDKYRPALLFDEASRTLEAAHGSARDMLNDLLAILDSGFEPGDSVVRTAGEEHDVRQFLVHTPVVLALLKRTKVSRTLTSRSVEIPLKKKLRSERAVPFSLYHDVEPLRQLARKIRRWCDDNRERVRDLLLARIERERADGYVADDAALFNRPADKWRPLFAIGEATGLLFEVEEVAAQLSALEAKRIEEVSDLMGTPLLADCKRILDEEGLVPIDWISPTQLAGYLNQMSERPWSTIRSGLSGGITPHMVVRVLADFDIFPVRPSTREGRKQAGRQGYQRTHFEDAWGRYLT